MARVAKYLFRVARRPGAGLTHSLLFEAQTPQVSLPRAARRPPRVFRFLWGVEVTEEIGMRIALGTGEDIVLGGAHRPLEELRVARPEVWRSEAPHEGLPVAAGLSLEDILRVTQQKCTRGGYGHVEQAS